MALIASAIAACQPGADKTLRDVAARCAIPISSIYLVRSGTTATVRENVNDGSWTPAGRACVRQWAATQGYTYFDSAPAHPDT